MSKSKKTIEDINIKESIDRLYSYKKDNLTLKDEINKKYNT